MTELSKYFKSESVEVNRSEIHLADYNPRTITQEAKKSLKQGIKKYGLLGGIIVNKRTGMTVVSGHQRLAVMDELNKFPDNDYMLRVDLIDVDEKSERELNILLNNPNAMGTWDYDRLAELIPDIDYKSAGLTDEDLQLIGIDFTLQTEAEQNIADELTNLYAPVKAQKEAIKEAKKELSEAEKIAHNKEVKAQVLKNAEEKAENMDSYVMISFESYKAKSNFMKRFGFLPEEKFIKGELFNEMIERTDI